MKQFICLQTTLDEFMVTFLTRIFDINPYYEMCAGNCIPDFRGLLCVLKKNA